MLSVRKNGLFILLENFKKINFILILSIPSQLIPWKTSSVFLSLLLSWLPPSFHPPKQSDFAVNNQSKAKLLLSSLVMTAANVIILFSLWTPSVAQNAVETNEKVQPSLQEDRKLFERNSFCTIIFRSLHDIFFVSLHNKTISLLVYKYIYNYFCVLCSLKIITMFWNISCFFFPYEKVSTFRTEEFERNNFKNWVYETFSVGSMLIM